MILKSKSFPSIASCVGTSLATNHEGNGPPIPPVPVASAPPSWKPGASHWHGLPSSLARIPRPCSHTWYHWHRLPSSVLENHLSPTHSQSREEAMIASALGCCWGNPIVPHLVPGSVPHLSQSFPDLTFEQKSTVDFPEHLNKL